MNRRKMKKLVAILAIVGALVGIVSVFFGEGIYQRLRDYLITKQPPRFEFLHEGALRSNVPVYEVTEELAHAPSGNPIITKSTFQISVSAKYEGDEYAGPVRIVLIASDGREVHFDGWESFQKSSQDTVPVPLDPLDLVDYSGVDREPFPLNRIQRAPEAVTKGQFNIEIRSGSRILDTERITVLNTPWYHTVQLSDSSIQAGGSVTAYVTVENIGGPSRFSVFCILYDATYVDPSTLNIGSEGWWPAKTWDDAIGIVTAQTEKVIGTNEEFSVVFKIPGESFTKPSFKFQAKHVYVVETYVLKKLPYLRFPDEGSWLTSEDRWRARNHPQYATIVVLE